MNLFFEKLYSKSNFLLFNKHHEIIIHLVSHLLNKNTIEKDEIRYMGNSDISNDLGVDNLISGLSKNEIDQFAVKIINEMMGSDKKITVILAFPVTMSMILGTSLKQLILMTKGCKHRIIISSDNVFVMPYYARKLFNIILIGSQMELMESKTIYEAYLNMFNSYDDVHSILSSITNDRFLMYNYHNDSVFGDWGIYPSSLLKIDKTYQTVDSHIDEDVDEEIEILSDFEIDI